MKAQKTLSLSIDVSKKLDEENNQSAVVEELLRNYYDMDE